VFLKETILDALVKSQKTLMKGDRQIILDNPFLVKYDSKQVLIFYLAKKRRRMTCPG